MKLIKDNCRALCFGRNNFIQQMQDGGKSGCGSAEKVEDPKPNMGDVHLYSDVQMSERQILSRAEVLHRGRGYGHHTVR